ncbi:MAG: site-specific DNA-methyltransferase [candidate division Zixibacteria bacterium]|nr:site-specific DNA-methyltransferase [candidate division Zixibacteria bacterium]
MDQFGIFKGEEIHEGFAIDRRIVVHTADINDFIKTIPDSSIRLIITSPPYNIGKEYETQVALTEYMKTQERLIGELVRVLADDGSICWQVGNYVEKGEIFPLDMFYYPVFKQYGLQLRNRIVWHFGHGLHASRRFSGRYETLVWFTKTKKYVFNLDPVRIEAKYPGKTNYKGPNYGKPSGNPLGKNPSDIWSIVAQDWETGLWEIPNVKANHPEKTIHPCQFPVELVQRCVLALTNEDDWVLDPYAGVGSALIAAVMHKRRAVGCDKESRYTRIAKERLEAFLAGSLKVRPLGKPVYRPTGREKVSQVPMNWTRNG